MEMNKRSHVFLVEIDYAEVELPKGTGSLNRIDISEANEEGEFVHRFGSCDPNAFQVGELLAKLVDGKKKEVDSRK